MSLSRKEIIRMARDAGVVPTLVETTGTYFARVENLANAAYAAGAAAEREACAKLCNDADKSTHPSDLAEAIRARGDK